VASPKFRTTKILRNETAETSRTVFAVRKPREEKFGNVLRRRIRQDKHSDEAGECAESKRQENERLLHVVGIVSSVSEIHIWRCRPRITRMGMSHPRHPRLNDYRGNTSVIKSESW